MPGNRKTQHWRIRWARCAAAFCLIWIAQLCPGAGLTRAGAAESVARDARLGGDAQRTRFVIVLSRKVKFAVRTLADPTRVIIDLSDVKLNFPAGKGKQGKGLVTGYRYGRVEPYGVRIILDIIAPVLVDKSSIWPARDGHPPRLVVDLVRTDRKTFLDAQRAQAKSRAAMAIKAGNKTARAAPALRGVKQRKSRNAKRVIVIDPGHGGIDPGSVSSSGTKEKNVVFSFSRGLRDLLKKTGRYEAILTRSTDSYISLRRRVEIGRRKGADLFISIHADSLSGRYAKNVSGATVYTLSEKASDDEAKALAAKENRSDIIAGVELPAESNDVTNILIDLAQRETKNMSISFADTLLASMRGKTKIRKKGRKSAGFRVLKAPDVPSVLIELGYMSNPEDVKLLVSAAWRKKVASAVAMAVDTYFSRRTAKNPY
ncbi:MAG: N-acetylmuramoyl-L-alanine amidase [Proteobacteria bacterium]|nr:N-acetylmuramoyl-L-alanine amidase [Pseudomonadota bacterium]